MLIFATSISCAEQEEYGKVPEETVTELAFQELYDQGIDKYLGTIMPISSQQVGRATEHIFDSKNGPVCYTGNQFSMFTRDGSSNNLLIFLQGGGLCGPMACAAIENSIPLLPFGILNPNDSNSPTFGYDLGYLPYCDGSLWMGDNDVDSDGDGENDRSFRGLQNLSASLDVVARSYPNPGKIVLAGNSAGGFGVHAALPLVRKLYPNTTIELINDSGIAILPPGALDRLYTYWNASAFLPASCTDCVGTNGNLTNYYLYQLAQDENVRMGFISATQDSTMSLALGGDAFESELRTLVATLNTNYPNRFNGLVPEGNEHTFLMRRFDFEVASISVREWLRQMLDDNEDWSSVIE